MSLFETGFSVERKDGQRKKFYGKYRALVTNNNDSKDKMGRIKVIVPAVLGQHESDWCNPCVPYAGRDKGMAFIPNVGDSVWVEFEGGDPNFPIYTGSWWGLNEMPDTVYSKVGVNHMIQTKNVTIHINDDTGALTIEVGAGNLNIYGSAKIYGNLTVTGNVVNDGNVVSSGDVRAGDDITAGGNITADGTVNGSNI